ncbi:MAG: glycosyltransferase family 1 protein, partial [Lachnospiraceae bacterium]|nr:glycosyltransferase family 1 protein [Lachnospiraceae bacterium]
QALLPVNEFKDSIASLPYIYANYFLARRLTSIERIKYLSALGRAFSKNYDLKLYTLSPSSSIPGFHVMGVAGYDTDMIHIFRESKININISLRSITNGIPLRCMDILASGGFLLSNYQNDLEREYVAGEDYVWFENEEDLVEKSYYYLSHEDERKRIAESGFRKTGELHSMKKTFEKIMAEFS